MSEQIDWGKAPEWASVRIRSRVTPKLMAWAESYTEDARFLRDDYDGVECQHLAVEYWELVCNRPTTLSWSGEGLPPVGVVCEVRNKTPGYCAFPWEKCTVALTNIGANGCVQICTIDHRGDFAIYYPEVDIIEFRPIRTPEQIATDARSKAIDEMVKALGMDDPDTAEYIRCGLIYDAGFRKQ